ncbi:MAG: molecular chaperone TorD family protein [Alphaproteobacteria bacterium]|nr:molecular chaperone TorD family protein [Alphaproteobacteria bacterium]
MTGTRDNLALETSSQPDRTPEELARQALYAFLTRALARPLSASEQTALSPFVSSETDLGSAAGALVEALGTAEAASLSREYQDLFIGVGRGELLPFASYYLTGFLNEKPLAELRGDMRRLGFARPASVKEPEDHIGSLCDIMCHLIEGTATGDFDIYDQDQFFAAHLKPWAGKFFADLEKAKTADAYRHVGRIGRIFMTIEEQSFGMIARA